MFIPLLLHPIEEEHMIEIKSAPISSVRHSLSNPNGFTYFELKAGDAFDDIDENYNHLFFLLEGKASINCIEVLGEYMHTGEFIFIPISSEIACLAIEDSRGVLFTFDRLVSVCEHIYFRELWNICSHTNYEFRINSIDPSLIRFLSDFSSYADVLLKTEDFQQLKHEELFYLLRMLYTKEEMAALFHPVVGASLIFKQFVLKNYLSVKNIDELVTLSGMKRKSFDRQFKEEYNESPYQWVLKQKAKHVRFALSETDDQIQDIMKRFGFTIAPHFTRFCKDQFNYPPLEYRKKLRADKAERHIIR